MPKRRSASRRDKPEASAFARSSNASFMPWRPRSRDGGNAMAARPHAGVVEVEVLAYAEGVGRTLNAAARLALGTELEACAPSVLRGLPALVVPVGALAVDERAEVLAVRALAGVGPEGV